MPVHPLKVAIATDERHAYEIAAAAHINPSMLSNIVAGKLQPSPAVRARLALALGRSESALFPEIPTAEWVADSRRSQGLDPAVTDGAALKRVTAALRGSTDGT